MYQYIVNRCIYNLITIKGLAKDGSRCLIGASSFDCLVLAPFASWKRTETLLTTI